MENITLNGELGMVIPDGFHRMSEEEIKRMNRIGGSDTGFCFSDPERHIIVSLAWK